MIRRAVAAVGVAAGIVLAAGPASLAMASTQPFSLSVSPGRLAAGTAGSVRQLTVANNGSQPVTVRAELSELSRNQAGKCGVGLLGTLAWAEVKPLSFTLPPGGHVTATLTIGGDVPGGAHGLVAAFVAVPGQGSGVSVSGAVGAQMRVQGNAAPEASHPCVALAGQPRKPHTSAATLTAARTVPWTILAIAAGLVAVIALLLVVILRQRRRIRANTPTAST
jgi:hypothetical protein